MAAPERSRAVVLGLAAFMVAALALGSLWILLGLATGGVSMCPSAPRWWSDTYFYALPPIVLVFCGWLGWRVYKNVVRRVADSAPPDPPSSSS